MRLLSLDILNYRNIREVSLEFGRGLNLLYGPNDLGKSSIREALRTVLLVPTASSKKNSFLPWAGGLAPELKLTFEVDGDVWRVEKRFATKGKAQLSRRGPGGGYLPECSNRAVDGRLRELLSWGVPAPGGRGKPRKAATFLLTALLGEQDAVPDVLGADLDGDPDPSGRAILTAAMETMGQDPRVSELVARLSDEVDAVYSPTGQPRRTDKSPLVRLAAEITAAEDRLETFQRQAERNRELAERLDELTETRDKQLAEHRQAEEQLRNAEERRELHEQNVARRTRLTRLRERLRAIDAHEEASQAEERASAEVTALEVQLGEQEKARLEAKEAHANAAQRYSQLLGGAESAQRLEEEKAEQAKLELEAVERKKRELSKAISLEAELERCAEGVRTATQAHEVQARTLANTKQLYAIAECRARLLAANAVEEDVNRLAQTIEELTASKLRRGQDLETSSVTLAAAEAEARKIGEEAARLEVRSAEGTALRANLETELRNARSLRSSAQTTAFKAERALKEVAAKAQLQEQCAALDSTLAQQQERETQLRGTSAMLEASIVAARQEQQAEQERETLRRVQEDEGKAAELRAKAMELRRRAPGDPRPALGAWPSGSAIAASVGCAVIAALLTVFMAGTSPMPAILAGAIGAAAAMAVSRARRTRSVADWEAAQAKKADLEAAALEAEAANAAARAAALRVVGAGSSSRGQTGAASDANGQSTSPETLAELEAKLASVVQQLADVVKKKEDSSQKRASVSAEIASMAATIEAAQVELGDLNASVERAKHDVLAATEREAKAAEDLRQLSEALSDTGDEQRAHAAKARATVEAAKKQMQEIKDEVDELTGELARKNANLEQRKMELLRLAPDAIEDELTRLTNAFDGALGSISELDPPESLRVQVLDAKRTAEQAMQARSDAEQRRGLVEAQLETLKERLGSDLLAALRAADSRYAELQGALQAAAGGHHDSQIHQERDAAEQEEKATRQRYGDLEEAVRQKATELTDAKAALVQARTLRQSFGEQLPAESKSELEATVIELQEEADRASDTDDELHPGEMEALHQRVNQLRERREHADRELSRAKGALVGHTGGAEEELASMKETLAMLRDTRGERELYYQAAQLLLQTIQEVEHEQAEHLGRALAEPVSAHFRELTGNRYASIDLTTGLTTEGVWAHGASRTPADLSVGTRDQLATLIRLAIARELKTALILDDHLVQSDPAKVRWFSDKFRASAEDHQILVFTCRPLDYLAEEELPQSGQRLADHQEGLLRVVNLEAATTPL